MPDNLLESGHVTKTTTLLNKIEKAGVKLLAASTSYELYKACISQALMLSHADYGSIFIEKNGQMIRVYSTVPVSYRIKPRPQGTMYKSFMDGKMRIISKKNLDATHPEALTTPQEIIVIPLTHQKKRLGAITLVSDTIDEYSPEEKQSFKLFGSLSTLAITNMLLLETVRSSLQTRELFLSTASHELKTPIASISAYAQLSDKSMSENKAVKPKWLKAILFNTHKLEILISDLFNISKMSIGGFEYAFKKSNLKEVLEKVISDYKVITDRKIVFKDKSRPPAEITADETKLTLVFNNVVDNALKYSPPDTALAVTCTERAKEFVIKVSDRGKGIAKDDLPHLFDRFYQGKNKRKGLGLGLYLSNEIINAHHGNIAITSKENKGTTVSIILPKG
jgi:signal transduction histidine kinase